MRRLTEAAMMIFHHRANLWNKFSLNNKTLASVDGAFGTQLCHHKLKYVIGVAIHHHAYLLVVNPEGLLCTDYKENQCKALMI